MAIDQILVNYWKLAIVNNKFLKHFENGLNWCKYLFTCFKQIKTVRRQLEKDFYAIEEMQEKAHLRDVIEPSLVVLIQVCSNHGRLGKGRGHHGGWNFTFEYLEKFYKIFFIKTVWPDLCWNLLRYIRFIFFKLWYPDGGGVKILH